MQKLLLFISLILLLAGGYYLLLPLPGFPPPPPGSLISNEPADTESIYRRAYYTHLSRSDIMAYYRNLIPLSLRLNHPPEEAYTFVRDQTRSSWLEELVHPFKDTTYINGFYPTKANEQINYNKIHYEAKITVRYVPSAPVTRLTVLGLVGISLYLLIKEYVRV